MRNKIIMHGLEDRANELRSEGRSQSEIASILSEESGVKISQMSVSRYFQAKREEETKRIKEAVNNTEELKQKAASQYLDVNKALLYFLKDIKDAITECKQKDVSPEKRSQLYNAALRDLEILSKRLGEISDQPTQVVINVMQVSHK